MVVFCDPVGPEGLVGSDFAEVVAGLEGQDYESLQYLFFLVGPDDEVRQAYESHIAQHLPLAAVRKVEGNPGYGPTQNAAARLVEGDNGLFLFLHDDVCLASNVVSELVTELSRSNAAVVGPKLVQWDDASLLQHVGMGVDRCGEIDPIVLPGEKDQQQHDAVADVFCLPSACLLVRSDLFRTLGGFHPGITFGGEEMELCWRVHLTGGRVVVVPSAVARHRENFTSRQPLIELTTMSETHRVATVLSCTSGARLLPVFFQMLGLSLLELPIAIATGKWKQGVAALRATCGGVLQLGSIAKRRRSVQQSRLVNDAEVHDLQVRGSARATNFLRLRRAENEARRRESFVVAKERERRQRFSVVVGCMLAAIVLVGSRQLFFRGVANIGQFVPFTESWRSLAAAYRLGWWPAGFGSLSPAPTGTALVAVASFFSLGNPALLRTLAIVGLLLVAAIGMWHASAAVSSSRARIAGVVTYLALPIGYECIATGRWGALACFAALPWVIAAFNTARHVDTARASDIARQGVRLGLVIGVVAAFESSFVPVCVVLFGLWWLSGIVSGGTTSVRGAASIFGVGIVSALLLQLMWLSNYVNSNWWQTIVGFDSGVGMQKGLKELASFDFGRFDFATFVLLYFFVLVVGLGTARGERFVLALRGATFVVVFLGFAVVGDTRAVNAAMPDPAVLLTVVALGLALGAISAVEAFDVDVKGRKFGWQQPASVLALCAIAVGVFPLAVNAANGRWNQPTSSLSSLLSQLQKNPTEGDYRILYLGNPQLLPAAPRTVPFGAKDTVQLGYAITDDGAATLYNQWAAKRTSAVVSLENTLQDLSEGNTPRIGRLLAPLGVRYIVVPLIDGSRSTRAQPLPLPQGLMSALEVQLDFRRQYFASDLVIYENVAWAPTLAQLTAAGIVASKNAGNEALVLSDLRGSTPAKTGFIPGRATQKLNVGGGTVSAAIPSSSRWRLEIKNQEVLSRPAFGAIQAFDIPGDVPANTVATLAFSRPLTHVLLVIAQFAMWVFAVFFALGLRFRRRRLSEVALSSDARDISFGGGGQ